MAVLPDVRAHAREHARGPDRSRTMSSRPSPPAASTFFGALIDNNLSDRLSAADAGRAARRSTLPTLMMGEHQCIVAQIEFAGTPIPNGANPFTSDKLSQRNIALSAVANPGPRRARAWRCTRSRSRRRRTRSATNCRPTSCCSTGAASAPEGTEVRLFIPSWNAQRRGRAGRPFLSAPRDPRDRRAHDRAAGRRHALCADPAEPQPQTGVIIADFPLGVKNGPALRPRRPADHQPSRQARGRRRPRSRNISLEEAARLIASVAQPARRRGAARPAAPTPRASSISARTRS